MKLRASGEDYLETILVLQKKLGMVKKTAVRVLLDEGYLVTPEKNRIKAKISIDGVVSYGYRFCYPKIDEAFGPVNDAVYTCKRQSLGPMQIMEEREAAYGRDYQITDQPKPIEGKLFLL